MVRLDLTKFDLLALFDEDNANYIIINSWSNQPG